MLNPKGLTSATVTKVLRRLVYPLLKAEGFDDWTSRCAWRRLGQRIDAVDFASLGTHEALGGPYTPCSFFVHLGIKTPALGLLQGSKSVPEEPRPHTYELPLQAWLIAPVDVGIPGPHLIWNVASERDAEACAIEIAKQFREFALAWLSRPYPPEELLPLVLRPDPEVIVQQAPNGATLRLSAGKFESPAHNYMLARLYYAIDQFSLAAEHFEKARWAKNRKTGALFLFRSPDDDAELRRLAEECARKA